MDSFSLQLNIQPPLTPPYLRRGVFFTAWRSPLYTPPPHKPSTPHRAPLLAKEGLGVVEK